MEDGFSALGGQQPNVLAQQRLHARPPSEDEARTALEWLAAREGKTLSQLVQELHGYRPAQVEGGQPRLK